MSKKKRRPPRVKWKWQAGVTLIVVGLALVAIVLWYLHSTIGSFRVGVKMAQISDYECQTTKAVKSNWERNCTITYGFQYGQKDYTGTFVSKSEVSANHKRPPDISKSDSYLILFNRNNPEQNALLKDTLLVGVLVLVGFGLVGGGVVSLIRTKRKQRAEIAEILAKRAEKDAAKADDDANTAKADEAEADAV